MTLPSTASEVSVHASTKVTTSKLDNFILWYFVKGSCRLLHRVGS